MHAKVPKFDFVPLYRVSREVKAYYSSKRVTKSCEKTIVAYKPRGVNDLVSEKKYD